MSRKKSHQRVAVAGGQSCPKCHQPMQRFRHPAGWQPRAGTYGFSWWDICYPCGHTQLYEQAKVWPQPKPLNWIEQAAAQAKPAKPDQLTEQADDDGQPPWDD